MDDEPILSVIAALAAPQNGCVSAAQLRAAGVSVRRAQSLRDRGAMAPIVPGVDLVGAAALTPAAAVQAGVLRGGAGAAVGDRTALIWRELLEAELDRITVWVPRTTRSRTLRLTSDLILAPTERPAGFELVPSRALEHVEEVRGIATVGAADAIVALAAAAVEPARADGLRIAAAAQARRDCRRAWNEADFKGVISRDAMRAAVRRRRAGSTLIHQLEREAPLVGEHAKLLSRAERRLLSGLVRRGLEPPCVNGEVEIGGRIEYPDFFYVLELLAVEVDGGGHDRVRRQVKDVERAERMLRHGILTLRFADTEIWRDLERCLDEIDAALHARRDAVQVIA